MRGLNEMRERCRWQEAYLKMGGSARKRSSIGVVPEGAVIGSLSTKPIGREGRSSCGSLPDLDVEHRCVAEPGNSPFGCSHRTSRLSSPPLLFLSTHHIDSLLHVFSAWLTALLYCTISAFLFLIKLCSTRSHVADRKCGTDVLHSNPGTASICNISAFLSAILMSSPMFCSFCSLSLVLRNTSK